VIFGEEYKYAWTSFGHRKQGKPGMRWLDSVKKATGLRLEDLREAVQDRKKMAYAGGRKDSE
jgi:hypothetical protein